MYFLQTMQAPVEVRIGDKVFQVPKLTMDELLEWAIEIQSQRKEEITADMNANDRRQFMTYYPQIAPDLQQMGIMARTVEGVRRIITRCLSSPELKGYHAKTKDSIPAPNEQEIAEWIKANGAGRLAGLAWELADLKDTSQENPNPGGDDETEEKDPLSKSGTAGSNNSSATGRTT